MCLSPCSVLAAEGGASADPGVSDVISESAVGADADREATADPDRESAEAADSASGTAAEADVDREPSADLDTKPAEAADSASEPAAGADADEEAADSDSEPVADQDDQGEIIEAPDLEGYLELTRPDLDGASFDVNKNTGRITGTEDDLSFDETFDTSFKKVKGSRKRVVNAINGTEGYQVTGTTGSKVHVMSDYSLGRVIVSDEVKDTYGAETAVVYDGESLLTYGTEEKTKQGFDRLTRQFGADKVAMDFVITLDDTVIDDMEAQGADPAELSTPAPDPENPKNPSDPADPADPSEITAHGWGTGSMYLDYQMKKYENSDRDVVIAVLDTGINEEHEIFSDTTISEDSMNFINPEESINDDHGHGTMVSGVIAESTTSNVELLVLKMLQKSSEGGTPATSWANTEKALYYAAEQGVDIINLSLGAAYSAEHCARMDSVLSEIASQGILICAASGNSGGSDIGNMEDGKRFYPADSPYTIAVGAVMPNLQRVYFSNYGENLDFTAPGAALELADYSDEAGYVTNVGGTSFACPYICAAAAFLLMGEEENSTDTVYGQLVQIADDLGEPGRDIYYGNGMPNFLNEALLAPVEMTVKPTVKVSTAKYTYDGKVKRPGVTVTYDGRALTSYEVSYPDESPAVGKHKVVVTLVGNYTDTVNVSTSFQIVPAPVTMGKKGISLYSSANKVTLRWSKSQGTYQIKFATNKNFKKAKTYNASTNSKTITGLKHGKTYYFKIRAVKKVGGKKYYSPWSTSYWVTNAM